MVLIRLGARVIRGHHVLSLVSYVIGLFDTIYVYVFNISMDTAMFVTV